MKNKSIEDFKLKKFVIELEEEIAANLKNQGNILNNEVLKAFLREDWIPANMKETLLTLPDFLNYILKSLKTVKSKIFYDKLAIHLLNIYK